MQIFFHTYDCVGLLDFSLVLGPIHASSKDVQLSL